MPNVIVQRREAVLEIVLNRPEKHNALSVPMRTRIANLVRAAEADDA